MLFEILEHMLRVEAGIGIVESGDEAEGDDVVLAAVYPGTTIFFRSEGPAQGVDDFTRCDAARWDFPKFFHADAVGLRVGILGEVELRDQLLGQRSARAFGENGDFSVEIVTRLEVGLRMAFLVHTFVIGLNAGNAVAVEKQFRACESGEDRNAGLFDLAAQPLHEAIQGDDVIAVIAQRGRRDGQLELALFGEKVNGLFRHLGIERGFFFESGKEFAHGSRIE